MITDQQHELTDRPWLITGFGSFGEVVSNPSGLTARDLHGTRIAGRSVVGVELPVVAEEAVEQVVALAERHEPKLILAMGVSSRPHFSLETTAWNECQYPIPDVAGHQFENKPIISAGLLQVFTQVPLRPIALAFHAADIPVALSQDPGRYVCNHFYYLMLQTSLPVLFLHGPPLQPDEEMMGLRLWRKAVRLALEALHRAPDADGRLWEMV